MALCVNLSLRLQMARHVVSEALAAIRLSTFLGRFYQNKERLTRTASGRRLVLARMPRLRWQRICRGLRRSRWQAEASPPLPASFSLSGCFSKVFHYRAKVLPHFETPSTAVYVSRIKPSLVLGLKVVFLVGPRLRTFTIMRLSQYPLLRYTTIFLRSRQYSCFYDSCAGQAGVSRNTSSMMLSC